MFIARSSSEFFILFTKAIRLLSDCSFLSQNWKMFTFSKSLASELNQKQLSFSCFKKKLWKMEIVKLV
jgi:hypothetical protein